MTCVPFWHATSANNMVHTKHTTDFRLIRFPSGNDLLAEAERIVAAERAGTLRRSGNWTVGQNFSHLATWIEFALDGYPPKVKPGVLIRVVMKLMKRKFMRGPLPRGVKIPGMAGGTLGADDMPTDAALHRLRRAWERLMSTAPTRPNPIFGPLPHEEWIQMHLRHAELHMGYLHP